MNSSQATADRTVVSVRNVGGIDEAEVTLEPGVTVLAGRNATNRSSLLQAIMAAAGGSEVSLKSDAEEGAVELAVAGERYTRRLRRNGDGVAFDGDPYLDSPELAELFAFLHEFNEARRTVRRDGDLRELILRPVDTEAIRDRVADRQAERRSVETELGRLDGTSEALTEARSELAELEATLEERRDRLAELRADIEAADGDHAEASELEQRRAELREARSRLEELRFRADSERESLERLRERRGELEGELDGLSGADDEELADLEARVERLRERRRGLDDDIKQLQGLISFNEERLEEGPGVAGALEDDGSVTDGLVEAETTVCWTCGSEVETAQIEQTVDRLTELRAEKFARRRELDEQLEELKERLRSLRSAGSRRERIEGELADTREEIGEREGRLERIETDREAAVERVAEAEAAVERLQAAEREELKELRESASDLEVEIGRLEAEREELRDRVEELEADRDRRERLQERRDALDEEIEELRTRIQRLEREAIEAFNEQMETVLGLLEYDNLERIWLERRPNEAAFDLNVVRSTATGAAYEDTVETLSESEREVLGLVVALAGYLVHDVHEQLPFMLLDSLEAIDADRIARLVEYFSGYADYLVVALLPEDAAAIEGDHATVTDI